MRKHGLSSLVLVLMAALALMAFGASAAQATLTPGFWLLKSGTKLAGTETIGGETTEEVKFKIEAKNTEIRCQVGKITEGSIDNSTEAELEGKKGLIGHGLIFILILFCGIFILSTGEENKACTEALGGPMEKGESEASLLARRHITFHILWLIHRHTNGKAYIIFEPTFGKPFTTLTFGAECSLPEKIELTGKIAVEAPATDSVKQTLSIDTGNEPGKGIQTLLGAGLNFGKSPMIIKGSSFIELTGANKGVTFGAM